MKIGVRLIENVEMIYNYYVSLSYWMDFEIYEW